MTLTLRRLELADSEDVYRMLQEIPPEEHGFQNNANGLDADGFRAWLARCDEIRRGVGLEDWMVRQTVYWLYADGEPVGIGKLRHRLNDALREVGGHIGYAIRPSMRGRGYGKRLLAELLRAAGALGIERALVTISVRNEPSIRVAAGCGGELVRTSETRRYYEFETGVRCDRGKRDE